MRKGKRKVYKGGTPYYITMRKTYVLSKPLLETKQYKRLQLNGKDVTKAQMIELLVKHGYNMSYRTYPTIIPAKSWRNIKLGTSYWGTVVWSRLLKENCKLGEMLSKEGVLINSCMLPVEKRRDKEIDLGFFKEIDAEEKD